MKTISLTEEAYQRLAEWKMSPRDSFSKVVSRVVTKRGTMGAILDAVQKLPDISEEDVGTLESEVRKSRDWESQGDAWTT